MGDCGRTVLARAVRSATAVDTLRSSKDRPTYNAKSDSDVHWTDSSGQSVKFCMDWASSELTQASDWLDRNDCLPKCQRRFNETYKGHVEGEQRKKQPYTGTRTFLDSVGSLYDMNTRRRRGID